MNIVLPDSVYSQDQLGQLLFELQQYVGKLGDAAVRTKVAHRTMEQPELSPALAELLQASGVNAADGAALTELQHGLGALRDKAPKVSLTLSALPNNSTKLELAQWFRKNIHPQVLLQFVARTDIGGGVVVRAGSRIIDLSFREQLLKNKHRISEIAGNVR